MITSRVRERERERERKRSIDSVAYISPQVHLQNPCIQLRTLRSAEPSERKPRPAPVAVLRGGLWVRHISRHNWRPDAAGIESREAVRAQNVPMVLTAKNSQVFEMKVREPLRRPGRAHADKPHLLPYLWHLVPHEPDLRIDLNSALQHMEPKVRPSRPPPRAPTGCGRRGPYDGVPLGGGRQLNSGPRHCEPKCCGRVRSIRRVRTIYRVDQNNDLAKQRFWQNETYENETFGK